MEQIKLNGVLTLKAYNKGILVWEKKDKNLIVTNGYLSLLNALIGTSNKYISKVQAGTNGIAPALTDTAITAPFDILITTTVITTSKLTINFEIGATDAVGMTIAEFGLITEEGGLFSRKAWTPFLKTADLTINGTWEINI